MSKVIRIHQDTYEALAQVSLALDTWTPSRTIGQLLDMSKDERHLLLRLLGLRKYPTPRYKLPPM